ncbi:MAG: ABC transporter permease, partial [Acidobacteria bacterium]|nr:ABC transporter permease [Acidobacteriota bacterium]
AIISDRLWRRRFSADAGTVGRTIASKTGAFQIVGVMPPGFSYPIASVTAGPVDVWLPFIPTQAMTVRGNSRAYLLSVVARLKPGVSVADASVRMARVRDALALRYPGWFNDHGVVVRRLQDAIVGASVRSWMLLLLGAVAVVVLMACLNAANLLVARAVGRGPELAVRTALGASRWDLARALLVESLVLSILGAAGGILVALWGVEILRATLPTSVPGLAMVSLNFRVLTITAVAAVLTSVTFGTMAALQASRPDVVTLLGQAGRGHSGGRAGRRLRTGLVVAEVGLAVVLLSGSGLFLTSFMRVTSVDLGFDPRHVITLLSASMNSSDIVPATTADRQARALGGQSVIEAAIERVRAVPGVVAVAPIQGGSPLSGSALTVPVQPADRLTGPFTDADEPFVRSSGPGYLEVVRGTLISGRWIADTDVVGATPVVVLSDEAARRYFGAQSPLGRGLLMNGYERTVVGIVRAMRWRGPESEILPEAFIAFKQTAHPTAQLIVRTNGDPAAVVPALQNAIQGTVPGATAPTPQLLEQSYAGLLAQRKFNMIILLLFGTVAVAIAAIGIYGLMAFVVSQRRREIGVRVALGALPSGILSMVLGRAVRLLVAGLVPGIAVSILLEQTARAFLFNAKPHDPVVYVGVAAVLLATGLAAAFGPARRATRLDPLVALRQD